MAFSDTEIHKITTYLGYPSHGADLQLVTAEIQLTSADGQTSVQALLTRLDALAILIHTDATDTAGIKGVDQGGVEFFEGKKLKELVAIAKKLVNQLSVITGIPVVRDYFSSCSGSKGGVWSFY